MSNLPYRKSRSQQDANIKAINPATLARNFESTPEFSIPPGVEFVPNLGRYKILTKSGYQNFLGVRRSLNHGIKIQHTGGLLECTDGHMLEVQNNKFVPTKELKVGDSIFELKILSIEISQEPEYYYDPVEVEGDNTYLSGGINHHNCLVCDEAAFIKPDAWEEFADSIFPSQSSLAWKKSIIISTAKGLNHFHDIVQRAAASTIKNKADPDNYDGTILVEVDWKEVPRFGSDGSLTKPEDFRKKIIEKFGRAYFEQNYGNNFTGSAETMIDADLLEAMIPATPQEVLNIGDSIAGLKIYEYPVKDGVYILGVDAAKDGEDEFAVQVLNITQFPFKQVAAARVQVNYLEMPEYLYQWGIEYNTALMIIENNEGAGQSIADTLMREYEYPNMHYDDKKLYPGFRTTVKTRPQILKLLQVLLNAEKILLQDKATIDDFLRFEKINGKYQAAEGHDDTIMALAMCMVPLINMDNFGDYRAFLQSIRSDEVIDTTDFLTNLSAMSFADF